MDVTTPGSAHRGLNVLPTIKTTPVPELKQIFDIRKDNKSPQKEFDRFSLETSSDDEISIIEPPPKAQPAEI